ncbi:MAG: mechanosensitive ion channel [Candidatus Nanohaloarchaea archaeon]|nr:mechanosensitive ion channel [Candidatus Nanohaloarchaea archaeon]
MVQMLAAADVDLMVRVGRFFLVLLVGLFLTRVIALPLVRRLLPSEDKKTLSTYQNLVTVIGIFASLSIALQAGRFGNLLTIFGAVTAALTVAIGFGMREEVGNVVSGILLRLNTPFVEQDYIATEKVEGVVKEVRLKETRLRGPAGQKVLVPNSHLGNSVLHNNTRDRHTANVIEVQVSHGEAEDLRSVMLEAAGATEQVLDAPEPKANITDITDEKAIMHLRYYIQDEESARRIRDRMLSRILEQCREQGIFTAEVEEDTAEKGGT